MGQAAIPAVGQILTTVVVGTVATKVAEDMGFGSAAGLIGTVAGVAAGGYAFNQAGAATAPPAQKPAPVAGQDLAKATALPPSEPMAPIEPIGADPQAATFEGYTGPGESGRAGMLNQATMAPTQPAVNTAQQMVQQGTVPDDGGVGEETQSFWAQMFNPEKTMDLAVGALGGMSKYQIAKEDREYPESIRKSDARGWEKQFGGPGQIGPSFSKYQRGS